MSNNKPAVTYSPLLQKFLEGKSEKAIELFDHFMSEFKKIGNVSVHPAKTMIGFATPRRRIAYVTQMGKKFIHIVFPFEVPYSDNLCFQKIVQVPGDTRYPPGQLRVTDWLFGVAGLRCR